LGQRLSRTLDELHHPPQDLLHPALAFLFARVSRVQPQVLKAKIHAANVIDQEGIKPLLDGAKELFPRLSHQAFGVYQQVSLSSLYLLATYSMPRSSPPWV
jgi:hypothetical protein